MIRQLMLCLALLAAAAGSAFAFDVEIKEVHAQASTVRSTIQLRGVVPDRFKRVIERGGQLHLRLQAELWENRPVWDRLVYPAIIRIVRMGHTLSEALITIDDSAAASRTLAAIPDPMEVTIDLGARDRLVAAQIYYVHVIATIGTLAEREVDQVGDAVFGKESDANGLGSFSRMVFQTALKIGDYLQSVTSAATSRKVRGSDIMRP
jgi:hypothetical protein